MAKKIILKNRKNIDLELAFHVKTNSFYFGTYRRSSREKLPRPKNFLCHSALNAMWKRLKMPPGASLLYDIFQSLETSLSNLESWFSNSWRLYPDWEQFQAMSGHRVMTSQVSKKLNGLNVDELFWNLWRHNSMTWHGLKFFCVWIESSWVAKPTFQIW